MSFACPKQAHEKDAEQSSRDVRHCQAQILKSKIIIQSLLDLHYSLN